MSTTKAARTKLERQVVVQAALRLLNRVGLDGLSMRHLAAELSVQAPALYWYFTSKQDLLDEMAHLMGREHAPPARPTSGQKWHEWMAERARAHRRGMLGCRDGARLHAGTRPTKEHRPEVEAMMRTLGEAGFSPWEAISGILAISHYTVGSAIEQQASAGRADSVDDAEKAPGYDFEATYEHGLRLLLAGMEATRCAGG